MTVRGWVGAAAVLAGLVVGPPAHAESHLIEPPGEPTVGPVLAGERLAWVTAAAHPRPGEFDLHHARLDGSDRQTVRLSIPATGAGSVTRTVVLAASERRWALRVLVSNCVGESACKYQFHTVLYAAVLSAPLGEVPTPVAGCTGGDACRPCDKERDSLDVFADVVAFDEPCRREVATVRDFSPGAATAERNFEGVDAIRLAGRFAAVQRAQLEVHDWVTGVKQFGVDVGRYDPDLDVQADGTLAYTRVLENLDSELGWASLAEPYNHRVGVQGDALEFDGIERGRIVFTRQHESDLSSHIGVVGLDGGRLALARPPAKFGVIDFDGERLAYAQRPCTVTVFVVWDMTGTPPGPPRGECPALGLAGRAVQVDLAQGRLSLELRCPAVPRLGCYGPVTVSGRRRGSRKEKRLAYDFARLAPGAERTMELKLTRRWACSFARSGDVARVKVQLDSWTRDENDSRRVRRSALVHGLASCGS